MKYVITGGEGFIGFHVCKELLSRPDTEKLVLYDAQKHYIPLQNSNWALYQVYRRQQLASEEGKIRRIRADMNDQGVLRRALEEENPDTIIHLAAIPIAKGSNEYPEEARRDVDGAALSLLTVLKDLKKIPRTVMISSSMVYGNFNRDASGRIMPATEDQHCDPLGVYDSMKLAVELYTRSFSRLHKFPHTIIRPSSVYGPTMANHHVIEISVDRAFQGRPIVLDNGGLQELDFSYVTDVAKGIVLAATSERGINETFNITFGQGRTVKDLADIVARLIPGTRIEDRKIEVFRPNRGTLDITKAKTVLGYDPQYTLEKGLEEYVQFYKDVVLPHYQHNTRPNI